MSCPKSKWESAFLRNLIVILLVSMTTCVAHGETVWKVGQRAFSVTKRGTAGWRLNDSVCVYQGQRRQACGRIFKITSRGLLVRIEKKWASIFKGDPVKRMGARQVVSAKERKIPKSMMPVVRARQRRAYAARKEALRKNPEPLRRAPPQTRALATASREEMDALAQMEAEAKAQEQGAESADDDGMMLTPKNRAPIPGERGATTDWSQLRNPTSVEMEDGAFAPTKEPFIVDVLAGAVMSTGYFFPTIKIQVSIDPRWTIGGFGGLHQSTGTNFELSALIGAITASYYPDGNFRGLWFQGSLGVYNFTVDTTLAEDTQGSYSIGATGGYRFALADSSINIGVAAGAAYVQAPEIDPTSPNAGVVTLDQSSFQPMALIDIGINF